MSRTAFRCCLPGLMVGTGAVAFLGLAGCAEQREQGSPAESRGVLVGVKDPKADAAPIKPVAGQVTSVQRQQLEKPFKDAVILDAPENVARPPDVTAAGKNVARIFEAVAGKDLAGGLWDRTPLFDAQGRRVRYTALVKTALGDIHVELLSEAAPNHVRNFVALARAGYYDGLPFHNSQRVETPEKTLAYLEAGCPRGTGEAGYGSVGYWLCPEISPALTHDVGSVGAWHAVDEPDTAACRFYITLYRAPEMDGAYTVFGKVVHGLDVAHTINRRPVVDEYPFDRPREPVVIRQVVIQSD